MVSNFLVLALFVQLLCHVALADKRDAADAKFTKCCQDKKLPCVDDCWYKGVNNTAVFAFAPQASCLTEQYFEDFAHCASGPTDNRDCCRKAGVDKTDKLCLELCDGTHPLSFKDPTKYYACAKVRDQIAQCDHDANSH